MQKGVSRGQTTPPDHNRGDPRSRPGADGRGPARRGLSAAATEVDAAAVEQALELLGEKFSEETSGIVLEHVAGGYAFRASAAASEACARLFEKPVEKGLSQAARETLAIVAY